MAATQVALLKVIFSRKVKCNMIYGAKKENNKDTRKICTRHFRLKQCCMLLWIFRQEINASLSVKEGDVSQTR